MADVLLDVCSNDACCNNRKHETMLFTKQIVFFCVSDKYLPVISQGKSRQQLNTDSCSPILMQPHDKFDLIH